MRLIDADKLMWHLNDWALHDNAAEIRECMKAVAEQPTVDPVEVFKSYTLKDNCNRICVWSDDRKRYKRFDFVAWENGDEEGV